MVVNCDKYQVCTWKVNFIVWPMCDIPSSRTLQQPHDTLLVDWQSSTTTVKYALDSCLYISFESLSNFVTIHLDKSSYLVRVSWRRLVGVVGDVGGWTAQRATGEGGRGDGKDEHDCTHLVHYCTLSLWQIIVTNSQWSIQRLSRWVTN